MIVDLLSHTGARKGETYPAEDLVALMDKAGVDVCMTCSQLEHIDNEYIAQKMMQFPDRLLGFAVINPWAMDAEEELERCYQEFGMRGLKLNAVRFGFAADRHSLLDPIFDICSTHKAAVNAHAMSDVFSIPAKWEEMARAFPDVPIILSHMGIPLMVESAFEVARRNRNIFLNTAIAFPPVVKRAIEEVGPEKILMASDAPYGSMEQEIQKIEYCTSDPAARRLILGENAQRLFALET